MEDKATRQHTLLQVLENKELSSQGAVVREMELAGFEVTQPSISRDFQELGIVKLGGRYKVIEDAQHTNGFGGVLVNNVDTAGPNMVVIRTSAGAANMVALEIDNRGLKGVVGTVAGDDTLFVATKNRAAQTRLRAILNITN